MTSPADLPHNHVFGCWSFDPDSGQVDDGSTTTRLEPQVAKLLSFFLANQDRVVSRDDLIAAAWDSRIVSDDAINRCISILRQVLTPNDKNAYIETLVRRGYIAHFPPGSTAQTGGGASPDPGDPDRPAATDRLPSSDIDPPDARAPGLAQSPVGTSGRRSTDRRQPPPARHGQLRPVRVLLLVMLGSALVFAFVRDKAEPASNQPAPALGRVPVVAVLPFASGDTTGDSTFFADGVHDDLLTQLAKLESLRVISSTSVREYRDVRRNLRGIGAELGADAILEGRVQIAENKIRINAQLIDVRSDEHVWAERYDRELTTSNIFQVQAEIARAIAKAMNAALTVQDNADLTQIPTSNMAAYRAYHRAVQIRYSPTINIGAAAYLQALQEAVELDPSFSLAWADLVSAYGLANFDGTNPQMTALAEQALAQLKAVAPDSADYLFGQASYFYYVLKDYSRAHDIINRALAMNPGDIRALEMRSWIERRQGDFNALLATRRKALALDPRNPSTADGLLIALLYTHRYDEAAAELEGRTLETYIAGDTRSLLQFRVDRDFSRMQESIEELCRRYEVPDCAWEARIANRQFAQALDVLKPEPDAPDGKMLDHSDQRRLLTDWLTHTAVDASQFPQQGQREAEAGRESTESIELDNLLVTAMLAGFQGRRDEAKQLVDEFLSPARLDWPVRVNGRHEACRILAMIEASSATVTCLRDGLIEPSGVSPFYEPYLPFYDRVRDSPEFIRMLAEIDPDAPANAGR